MDDKAPRGLYACFRELEDPRVERTRHHRLEDILGLSLIAVVAGAEGPTDIEDFGRAKEDWLRNVLPLEGGIPAHDTIGRVLGMLDPEAFERCLLQWIEGLVEATGLEALHIDGKTLRRSFERASSKAAIHMVSVWASEAEVALAQLATDEKSNEITAISKLLELITLERSVVTIDAMGCQREIAKKIVEGSGDYILALKQNQSELYEDVKLLLNDGIERNFEGMSHDVCEQTEKNHGRVETRRVWVTRDVEWLRREGKWANLRSAICVEAVREVQDPAGGPAEVTTDRRYYISSVDPWQEGQDASFFARHIRGHWGVENKLHWTLDVTFREDESRLRQGCAAENLSRLRRIALNMLKQEKRSGMSIRRKRRRAGWDHDFMLRMLGLGE